MEADIEISSHQMVATLVAVLLTTGSAVAQDNPVESQPQGVAAGDTNSPARLDTILVQPAGEPEPELPLGTGVSGKTLATTAGSAGDPLRSLQTFPGLVFIDDEEASPAVRGSRPDDNYFEVDFIPADYLFHADGLISVFNADLVKDFSIYPSAYSAEYSGVTGGIFDVSLRDPRNDKFHTTIDVSILQAGLLFEGPVTENQSFYLAGRVSYLDLLLSGQVEEEDEEGITLVQFPKYTDYQAKYLWDVNDKTTVTFQANGATDDLIVDVDETAEDIATDPIIVGRIRAEAQFNQQALVVDRVLGDSLSLKSAISHNKNEELFQVGGAGNIAVEADSWMLKSHLSASLGSDHDVTLGAQATRTDFSLDLDFNVPLCTEFESDCTLTESERLARSIVDTTTFGHVFIKDSWYITDNLTLFPGLTFQYDNYLDKSYVEPRLALEYALSDTLSLSAGVGLYHQAPDFGEIDEELGNDRLDYIESTQAVVGLHKKLGKGWDVKSELYYKKLDGLVTGDDELRFANNGEGETLGLDTLVRKELTNRFSGWLSLSVSESTRTHKLTGEQFDFEYDQPFNASLVGSYKLTEKWNVGAKFWVHSGALYTPVLGATPDAEIEGFFNPQYGELNSERFPTYNRLDIRFDRTVENAKGRRSSFYFDVLNVLGTKNTAYYEYNADYSERTETEQIPRIFAIGYKTTF